MSPRFKGSHWFLRMEIWWKAKVSDWWTTSTGGGTYSCFDREKGKKGTSTWSLQMPSIFLQKVQYWPEAQDGKGADISCVLSVWSQDITLLQFSKDDMNTYLKTTVVVYNGEAEEQDKEQYNLLLTKLWWRRKFSYLAASDSHFNEVAKKQWIKANVLIDCGCYGTLLVLCRPPLPVGVFSYR